MGIRRKSGEVVIISAGSRSQPGTLMGVGPGLCGLPRIPILGTWVNKGKKKGPSGTDTFNSAEDVLQKVQGG